MGKQKSQRRLGPDSAKAVASAIRTSARKLNLVAGIIRGKKVADAVVALDFTKRRVAKDVKRVLQAAVANAENNHQLDVDKLIVSEASVGRAFVMKRWMPRGRGKSAGVEKPFSNLTVVVKEAEVVVKAKPEAKAKNAKADKKPVAKKTADTAQAGA
jgi:large subunit ribosomal protein L22